MNEKNCTCSAWSVPKPIRIALIVVILLGIIASITVMLDRVESERAANYNLFSMEWTQIDDTAARAGLSVEETIDRLLDYDGQNLLNGIVYKEPSFDELQTTGMCTLITGNEVANNVNSDIWNLPGGTDVKSDYNYIICSGAEFQQEVHENIAVKTAAAVEMVNFTTADSTIYAVATSLPRSDLLVLGVGYPSFIMDTLQEKGVQLVVQVRSWPKVDQESVDYVFDSLADYNVVAVGFNDAELPGVFSTDWGEISALLAAKLQEYEWPLLQAEFFSQTGLETVAAKMDYEVARMHSIPEKDLATLTPSQLADRFQLATGERNMGISLFRMNSKISFEENLEIASVVADAIAAKGTTLGQVGVASDVQVPLWVTLVITLAVAAGGLLLCERLGLKRWSYVLAALGVLGALGLILIGRTATAQQLVAFAAVVVFPTLAVLCFVREDGQPLLRSIAALVLMTCISLIGAIFVVGLLSTRNYMTAVAVFSGVKVSQLLPLVILAAFYWYVTTSRKTGERNLLLIGRDLAIKPVTIGIMVVAVLALAVLALYMARSGNDTVTVSEFERMFRSYMDKLLYVRPRTKEFMFAHPLMLLALYYGYRRNLWPLVVLGAIGQVSLVNTFEHLHTPLWVSFLRTGNGLLLGLILGVILVLIVRAVVALVKRQLAKKEQTTA